MRRPPAKTDFSPDAPDVPDMPDMIGSADEFAAAFSVSRETVARLVAYQALLGKWQKSINLVGSATLQHFWQRHVVDSAQILAHAPPTAQTWLDLGSGAGFPGLVLAIILAETNPRARVHMVESDRKKANFLRTVLRDTGIDGYVHHARLEALSAARPTELTRIDAITARALAPLTQLAAYMAPFFDSSTIALLHKGRDWQEELTQARKSWTMMVETHLSRTDEAARIVEISQLVSRADAGQPAAF